MRAARLVEKVPKLWLDGSLVRTEISKGKRYATKMDVTIAWHAAMGALIDEWQSSGCDSATSINVRGTSI